jgi:predicted aspartyl protease
LAGSAVADCSIERRASLPVTMLGFMPTVAATIDGKPVRLGVDTGAQGTVLTPDAVERLGLPRDSQHFTTAIGRTGRILVSNAILGEFDFAGEVQRGKSVAVIALGQPLAAPGQPMMDGIVGAELLSRFDLDLDLPHRRLTLYRIENCSKVTPRWRQADYRALSFTLPRSGRPVLPVQLDGRDVTAIFDSGASASLLSPASDKPQGGPSTLFIVDENAALSPRSVARLRIADEDLPPQQLGRLDFPLGEADMLIGEDYMASRRFWLSYATRTLFISQGDTETGED